MKTLFFTTSLCFAIIFAIAGIILIKSDFQIWKWGFIIMSFLATLLYSVGAWQFRPWNNETSLN